MKEDRLRDQFRRENRLTILSVASLILFVLALLVVGMVMMYRTGLITLPEWLSGGDDRPMEVLPGDEGMIDEALRNPENRLDVAVTWDMTAEEVRRQLLAFPPLSEYTAENRVTVYGGHMQNTVTNKIWRSGEKYRLESYDSDGTLQRVVISDGSSVLVTEYSSRTESVSGTFPVSQEFSLENQAGMPDLAPVYRQWENAGEESSLTDLSVALARTAESNVYYLTYGYEDSPVTEEIFLSLEYGMVVNARSYDDGETIYQLVTTSLEPSLEGFDPEQLFAMQSPS